MQIFLACSFGLQIFFGFLSAKLDGQLMRRMRKSLRRLAKKHGLDTQEKEKDPAYIEDTATLQKTVLRTQEKRFWLGLQRMQICLYNLLGLFTLNRKSAILNLRFKDLRVSLQRDPSGGPHPPTVELSYEFTKHLGFTQTNTFTLPEIIYEPSLILSPHTFLFGILFFFEAFSAPSLTSMAKLRGLEIGGGRQQLLIPLKPEMANHYVFCRVAKEDGEVRIFPEEKMDPSSSVRTMAEIAGFLHCWFNHRFQYGGGLILNKSESSPEACQYPHVSGTLYSTQCGPQYAGTDQRLGPQFPSDTSHHADRPLSRQTASTTSDGCAEGDRGTGPRAAGSHPKARPGQTACRAANDPGAIEKLEKRTADVNKTRKRLLYKYRKRVREEFDDEQAVIDIERQLSGEAVDEEAKETLQDEQLLPAMIYLFSKLLTWPTSRSVEVELRRRDAGADAVQMYCGVLEGGPRRGRRPKAPPPPPPHPPQAPDGTNDANDAHGEVTSAGGWDDALRAAEEHIRDAKQPRGCFECYAHPGSSDHRRVHRYSRPADLGRHFRDEHLRHLKDGEPAWCSWCQIKLEHRMHVQSHAKMIHRVHT
ncbi:predicted protein [Histoplasma mississippiense (nom. inval.)]|uniref:predicted protein n=1 Tax=Ajellomyces capsulatus (strain NAm1 / WU24) TaxID=2059318 RepID=UPI000157C4A9|nr:predicted protein [Histoplasma mississippiense (nom. inval.)]EDN08221.1 predicted protein [Histoplasma mississippiense (nom. inval.)]